MIGVMGPSIVLYLSLFTLATMLFYETECAAGAQLGMEKVKPLQKIAVHVWAGVAIMLICLFAAFRADSVGADTDLYPPVYMEIASRYSSILDFFSDSEMKPWEEPVHALVVWVCSRITPNNKILLLFAYQLLTIAPVYATVFRFRREMPLSIGMGVYLFFFFNNSLNLMRQSIACAFLLLAFSYLLERGKPNLPFFMWSIVAILFHRSGIYGFVLLSVTAFVLSIKLAAIRLLFYGAICLAPFLVFPIAEFLVNIGFGDSHLEIYLNDFQNLNETDVYYFNPLSLPSLCYLVLYAWLVWLPIIINALIKTCDRDGEIQQSESTLARHIQSINIAGFLMYASLLVALHTSYGSRFSLFFDFFLILGLPLACTGRSSQKKKTMVFVSLAVVWLIWIVRMGWSASVPYSFYQG